MLIRTVKEDMSCDFNLPAATSNIIYAILKVIPKFMISRVTHFKL